MEYQESMSASALAQIRNQIFDSLHLHNWADGIMDLIDTLSSAGQVRSVVELSLQPAFHGRHYSGLYKAVRYFPLSGSQLRAIFADYLPHPQERPFRLLAVDTVPHPRPFADCLQDRGYIYQPNPTPGGKPVAVGHTYSLLAFLPERESASSPPWVVFLDARRVATDQNAAQVAQEQVSQWLEVQEQTEQPLPACRTLVEADTRFSTPDFIYPLAAEKGSNVLVRVRSNRVFFCPPPQSERATRGHPRWYGKRFALDDPTTWPHPDEEESWEETTHRGRTLVVHLEAWRGMRMRGTRQWPMHLCPCTLIRVWTTAPEGEMVHPRPLWLALFGPCQPAPRHGGPAPRHGGPAACGSGGGQEEWPLREVVRAYLQRSHQEHGHRFLKRNLLATTYQTPEVRNEEHWWRLVLVAAFQIWLARDVAQSLPRPWERYLFQRQEGGASPKAVPPSHVQRDMGRIIRALGSPARRLQPRGKPVGRRKGMRLTPRARPGIVRKGATKGSQTASQPN